MWNPRRRNGEDEVEHLGFWDAKKLARYDIEAGQVVLSPLVACHVFDLHADIQWSVTGHRSPPRISCDIDPRKPDLLWEWVATVCSVFPNPKPYYLCGVRQN